jgi:hypothetical protein
MNNTILSLANIELELPLRPVVDDLGGITLGLSLARGPEAGYAALMSEIGPAEAIAGRANAYAGEVARFLALAGTSGRQEVALFLDMLIALSLLNAASVLAVAIVPPRHASDQEARTKILADVVEAIGEEDPMAEAARLAFGYDAFVNDDAALTDHDRAVATEPSLRTVQPDGLAFAGLEQGLSLTAFLRSLSPAATLVERTKLQLQDAERFAARIETEELEAETLDRLQRAHAGASLLAAADLARACLIDAVSEKPGNLAESVSDTTGRFAEPRLRDIVIFAVALASRLAQLRRMRDRLALSVKPL